MTKTAAAEALTPDADFRLIPIAKLTESPSNHRRKSWGDLDELAASIKSKGVLVPICVRPANIGLVEDAFEIVYGHRRFRAASKAGLAAMPAIVRVLTDVEVIEEQIIENWDREGVHPLEEAEGLGQLLQPAGPYTIDALAAKLGKSRSTIYARLKLLDLVPTCRDAFYDGKLSPSTALRLARVPKDLQLDALGAITPRWRNVEMNGPLPDREVSRILQQEFMHPLGEAPFALDDADLVPSAGACAACPKRSGAQPDLFSDVEGANVCTDSGCYRHKLDAMWERRIASGAKVLADKEVVATISEHGRVEHGAAYVDLDTADYSDPKHRTYRKLLGKRATEAVVLARRGDGPIKELIPKKDLGALLKAAGHTSLRAPSAPTSGPTKEEKARAKAAAELDRETQQRLSREIDRKIVEHSEDVGLLRLGVVHAAAYTYGYSDKHPFDAIWPKGARDAATETAQTMEARFAKQIAKAPREQLLAGLLLVVLDDATEPHSRERKDLLALLKVDEKAIRAEVKLVQKAIAAPPAKGAKAAPPELKWVSADDEHTAEPIDGLVYHVAPTPGGKTWVAKVSTTHGDSWKTIGAFTTLLSDAKKLCEADLLERGADAILKNAGAGKLNAKGLKGAAVASKKGGRR